ncbi:hypothetical protein G9464_19635 [Halostella sp. JP-L12]|uniref:DUF7344 domain-containing protein n=1 Tax=Halostella TaxID=1843185 RepID=UPI000EF82D8B|nr:MULTISPECIES: hypothetical protein [Halostella]NHN49785.1 hypothetical protein [Halostella sp. JP-L12]
MSVTQESVPPEGEEEIQETAEEQQTAEGEEQTKELSLDVMFEVLKNERRRFVLKYFDENEGPVALGDLAEHVAARENDKPVRELTSGERKRVYVGLYQCHLPKMDDAGIVDFNRNRGRIELGPNADLLDEYLETETETERPWPRYYLGIAAVGSVLFTAGQVGLYPFEWVTGLVVALVIAAFAGCALVHDQFADA